MESVIRAHLIGDAAIAALISTRVYPVKLPQGCQLPAIRYKIISNVPLQGIATDHAMPKARMQIDCWADEYDDVLALRAAVKAALNRWSDSGTDPPILDVQLEDEIDDLASELFVAGSEPYRRILDFLIDYRE